MKELTPTEKEIVENTIFGFNINSENRFSNFLKYQKSLTDYQFAFGLGLAYTCSDNLFTIKKRIKAAFNKVKKIKNYKDYLMTPEENNKLKSLPAEITIYRAMTISEFDSKDFGISWTLDFKVADFFAYIYLRNYNHLETKIIVSRSIKKNEILAYFSERKESEVIVLK